MAREHLSVTSYPHPFSTDADVRASLFARLTPGEVLDELDWPLGRDRYTRIYVDGVEVLRPQWDDVQLVAGARVDVRLVPAGGGGGGNKELLGLVAMIGLALAAPQLAVALGATAGTLGATALAAGITIAGSLAMSALFKPPMPSLGASDTPSQQYSIVAQSNQATPYGPIPRVYGRIRMFPRIAVVPYSVNLSGANYLHAIYDFGYGPLQIEDIRIGTTPLTSYQSVKYAVHQRWVAGDPLEIFGGDQDSQSLAVTVSEDGQQGTRNAPAGTKQVVFDINFPVGLFSGDGTGNGDAFFRPQIDGHDVSLATLATLTFAASIPGVRFYPDTIAAGGERLFGVGGPHNRNPFGVSVWMTMPDTAEHAVTLIRWQKFKPPGYLGPATWWQFRTIAGDLQGDNAALAMQVPHTILELQVRANDQLSGTIDTLSAIATSILPVWDGVAWTEHPTRNPAWHYADILRGSAANRPVEDARLDLAELLEWAQDCDTAAANDPGVPQYCCDIVFDWRATVREALQTVAACGRASLNIRDGKFSVIRDVDPGPPVQVVTKRNSWDFAATMPYLDQADALNVTFFDELTWTENTIPVYADGFSAANAELFEELKLPGIVRHNQAWRFGRYYMAQAILRRERASITMDAEGLIPQRGDLVTVAHDVLRVGGFPFRVVSLAGNTVRVDEAIGSSSINAARVRRNDRRGLADITPATLVDATHVTLGSVEGVAPGDIILLGTSSVISGDYVVEKVRPGMNLMSFGLDLVEHRPEVRTADTGPIPPRVPKPGLEPDGTLASPAPLIPLLNYEIVDGVRQYDVALTWTPSPLATLYRVMIQQDGQWREIGTTRDTRYVYELAAGEATTGDVVFGVQAMTDSGVGSEIASASVHLDPPNDPWPAPPAPTGITATPGKTDVVVRWQQVHYDFIDFYVVRLGETWDTPIGEWRNKTLVQAIPPQKVGTYKVWVKTVDPTGRESAVAGGPASFTVQAPLKVSIIGTSITNTAYLRWGSLALGNPGWTAETTHRIAYYEIAKARQAATVGRSSIPRLLRLAHPAHRRAFGQRFADGVPPKLSEFEDAQGVGRSSTEFSVLTEQQEGNWRYGVRAVDVAGNMAPWAFVDIILTPPDNYFLLDYVEDILPLSVHDDALGYDGHFTAVDADSYLMPYDTDQTWQSHFESNAFDSAQAQVDAGFPLYLQPGSARGTFTFEHDYEDTIPQVRLSLQPEYEVIAQEPVVTGEVYTKIAEADPWVLAFTGLSGTISQEARFVRTVLVVEPGADRRGVVLMHGCSYTFDVHYVNDQGISAVAAAGTLVPFHVDYNRVVAVQLTPASPAVAYCQFVLADPPTGMTLYAFGNTGAPVDGQVSWTVRGF